ncbi:MAG: hypothetical protein JHC87_08595, partial [Thermoleophilaceae bacterium]|nr:hypothetical protein [Thermoleophilaceae bacterium]
RIKTIYNEIHSRDERIELNLYVVGDDSLLEDEPVAVAAEATSGAGTSGGEEANA